MKRALSVIFIVVLLIGFGIWELLAVNNFIEQVNAKVTDLNDQFPSTQQSLQELSPVAEELYDFWYVHENLLCLLHNHKDLTIITETITRLKTNIQLNNYDNAKQEMDLLKAETEKLSHNMTFSSQNIF